MRATILLASLVGSVSAKGARPATMTAIHPKKGSFGGGTLVTISGGGFAMSTEEGT